MTDSEFKYGSVPVAVVARIYQKDRAWVREGIIMGWLPIGVATRKGKIITDISEVNQDYGRINFYVSPKKLYEQTGYIWKGERK